MTTKTVKKLLWIGAVLAAIILSIAAGMYYYLSTTTAEYDAEWVVPGLTAEIEIVRDAYGMPHIYAATDNDAALAMGYCMAQDRLFQMEMIRRAVQGRLSEVLGPKTIGIDKLFRVITSGKSTAAMYSDLPPEVRDLLDAYARGVNYYLVSRRENLPVEFALVGFEPQPWDGTDCLAMLYYMAWTLNFSFDTELAYAAISDRIGPSLAAEIFIDYPDDGRLILDKTLPAGTLAGLMETIQSTREFLGIPLSGASNNWAVTGEKSVTGFPLLANDMHLGLVAPAIWYETHINTPNQNVSGVVLPGVPFIIAGANDHVAWGFTNLMNDDADYYLEKLHPDSAFLYQYQDTWERMDQITDTIFIRDDSAVAFNLRRTRHGPIINDIIDSAITCRLDTGYAVAMRWTLFDAGQEAVAHYLLNRAASVDDIEHAASLFKCPGQNWVYADDRGNIGYLVAAGIPVRNGFTGQGFLPGWDGRHEWAGYIPPESLPHTKNPHCGWVASANNKPTGENAYYISHCFGPPDRIERIGTLLAEKEKLSVDDFARMQADIYMPVAARLTPEIIAASTFGATEELERKALDSLTAWDYRATADGVAPTIYHTIWYYLLENTFKPRLGDTLFAYYLTRCGYEVHKAMHQLLNNRNSVWFDDPETESIETLDTILAKSFLQAIGHLAETRGRDLADWSWGQVHTLTMYHPLGRYIPIISRWLNIGPFPVGGSTHTVNPTMYRLGVSWAALAGASQRHIFDLADINRSRRIIPTGVSGNFMSPHYADQTQKWLAVSYRPFQLDRKDIERDTRYRTILRPAAEATAQSH